MPFHISKVHFFYIFLILIIIGFGVFYFFFFEKNIFSKEDVILSIIAPDEVNNGEIVDFIVKIKNNSQLPIKDIELTFYWPKGAIKTEEETRDGKLNQQTEGGPEEKEGGIKKDFRQEKVSIQNIMGGSEEGVSFKAKIFGYKDEKKEARATIYYFPKDINIRYSSKTNFSLVVRDNPLLFNVSIPSHVAPADNVNIEFSYSSISDVILDNLMLKIKWPSGFNFLNSSPEPIEKTNIWSLGSLNIEEGGSVKIGGTFEGESGEEKVIEAEIGREDPQIGFIILARLQKVIKLTKSEIEVFRKINGDPNYIAKPGDLLIYEILYQNKKEAIYNDLKIEFEIKGKVLDASTLSAPGAKILNGKLVWDSSTLPELAFVGPYGKGKVSFSIKVRNDLKISGAFDKNLVISEKLIVNDLIKEYQTRVATKVGLSQMVFYNIPKEFKNINLIPTGPLPPEINQSTKFLVVWEIKNSTNNIGNVKVESTLPDSVQFVGQVFPKDAKFSFNKNKKIVTLSVNTIEAGTGFTKPSKVYAFLIEIIPTKDQSGKILDLIGEAKIIAKDSFCEIEVFSESDGRDTTLVDDIVYQGDGRVK